MQMHSFDVCLHYLGAHQIDEVNIPIFLQLPRLCSPVTVIAIVCRRSVIALLDSIILNVFCSLCIFRLSRMHKHVCSSLALRCAHINSKKICVFLRSTEKKRRDGKKMGRKIQTKHFECENEPYFSLVFRCAAKCDANMCSFLSSATGSRSLSLSMCV